MSYVQLSLEEYNELIKKAELNEVQNNLKSGLPNEIFLDVNEISTDGYCRDIALKANVSLKSVENYIKENYVYHKNSYLLIREIEWKE